MSHLYINNVVGSGTYAVPGTDAELSAATAGIAALLDTVTGFAYQRCNCWVTSLSTSPATRVLNVAVDVWTYNGEENPDATEVQAMNAAIAAALTGDANINSIGTIDVQEWINDSYWLWVLNGQNLSPVLSTAIVTNTRFADGIELFCGSVTAGSFDVDLSSIVGARVARVTMIFGRTSAPGGSGTGTVIVRPKGCRLDFSGSDSLPEGSISGADKACEITSLTNDQGIVEVIVSANFDPFFYVVRDWQPVDNRLTWSDTYSCLFDGVDEYCNISDVTEINYERTDKFSIALWFKTSSNARQTMFSHSTNTFRGYFLSIDAGRIVVDIRNNTGTNRIEVQTTAPSATYDDGDWHHVSITYDGSSTAAGVSISVDGGLPATATIQDGLSLSIVGPTQPAQISGAFTTTDVMEGNIDEVTIWGKELTIPERVALYNAGTPADPRGIAPDDLDGYWQMGEDANFPCIPDRSGCFNGAIMTNMEVGDIVADTPP
jgi:hypothetical protein